MSAEAVWTEGRHRPLDFNGPVAVPFEPFQDSWIDRPLLERFEAQAQAHPDKLAIDDGRTRLTYAQTRRAVHKLAVQIDEAAPPGEVVVAILANTATFPVAILAALASGRPLIPVDVGYPALRKAAILQEAGAGALLVAEGIEIEPDLAAAALPRIVARLQIDEDVDLPIPKPSPAGLGGVVFTSGSTGRPKGVAFAGRSFLFSVAEFTNSCHINSGDRILSLATLSVGGLADALTALYNGATVRICDIATEGLGEVLRILREERMTVLSFIPLVVRTLMQLPGAEAAFTSLRILNLYGERTLVSDVELFRSRLPADAFIRVSLASMEAATMFHGFVAPQIEGDGTVVASGYLARDVAAMVLDEAGAPVAPGEEGELVVRGSHMALSAWQDGQMVTGPFLPDPKDPSRRIFATGDLVRVRADGLCQHVGRRDRRIKVRGMRVDPTDIEAVLRSYPGVDDATVVALPAGEESVLVGFFQAKASAPPPSPDHLRTRLGEDLPAHMALTALHATPSIPRLPNHKPDLVTLRARAQALGVSAPAAETSARPSEDAPDERIHRAVERAWTAVLGPGAGLDGRSFGQVGGDSLKALQLVLHLEAGVGHALPLDVLEGESTQATLAAAVGRALAPAPDPHDVRPRIFLLPGIGGDEPLLAGFRRSLAAHVRFDVLSYPDIDRPVSEIGDFSLIVGSVMAQVEARRGGEPIRLAGYSMGGVVGLEMARQLEAQGSAPVFLGVLDTPLVATGKGGDHYREQIAGAAAGGAAWLAQFGLFATLVKAGRYETARRLIGAFRRRFGAHRGLAARKVLLEAVRRRAMQSLPMGRRYGGPVTLFRSSSSPPSWPADLGWGQVADRVDVRAVPGDHITMLAPEHTATLAASFLQSLTPAADIASPAVSELRSD